MQIERVQTPEQVNRSERSLYIPGFIVGFVLTALLIGVTLLSLFGISSTKIAELRGRGQGGWTPPPIPTEISTGIGATVDSEDAAVSNELTGAVRRNITSSFVNIRESAGYLGKPAGDVVGQSPPGGQVVIIHGPEVEDGLNWWYVRTVPEPGSSAYEGWIAEATAGGVQILGE